ncbi:MAG: hypothetical protein EZS28_036092 [Streblomastix strix]|uniref:Uncharacterized protein n=1 Tax=Streblomastix strix TaxID=222440 RepID=A0A5J4UEQ3_9EUKA|nr:MAG: hypothetical protein EZS28_036092 [Streblomastix strix]
MAATQRASVPTNAITQSPKFGLVSGGQLLNKYQSNQPPPGNRSVIAYDAVSVILSPQTIKYGSEPLDAKKFYRSRYELKSKFGPQQVQVTAVAQVAQDNVL